MPIIIALTFVITLCLFFVIGGCVFYFLFKGVIKVVNIIEVNSVVFYTESFNAELYTILLLVICVILTGIIIDAVVRFILILLFGHIAFTSPTSFIYIKLLSYILGGCVMVASLEGVILYWFQNYIQLNEIGILFLTLIYYFIIGLLDEDATSFTNND